MKKLNLMAFVPVMDILLTFGDDEIEVNVTNNNPEGQPQIDVYNVGGTDVDEDTRKEYTNFVINKIKSGELKLPDSIVLYTTAASMCSFNESKLMKQQYQTYPVVNRSSEKITHTCCYAQFLSFFKNVMIKLGYYDWSIKFCNDNYCWKEHKRIDIDPTYDGDVRQIILHEIAHIDTAKYCNQKHNPDFWKRLNYLTWKFLKKDLDNHQKRHKEYMTNGVYGLCYKN